MSSVTKFKSELKVPQTNAPADWVGGNKPILVEWASIMRGLKKAYPDLPNELMVGNLDIKVSKSGKVGSKTTEPKEVKTVATNGARQFAEKNPGCLSGTYSVVIPHTLEKEFWAAVIAHLCAQIRAWDIIINGGSEAVKSFSHKY